MDSEWQARQAEMEDWYATFAADEARAAQLLDYEYRPHAAALAAFRGDVLDIGGGAGLAAGFLRADVRYVVLDPSPSWNEAPWPDIRRRLSPAAVEPDFVSGVGEALPFGDCSFDGALSFWSFNHAQDPERCVAEMHRVLRPGGVALVVLEDVEPTWRDVARLALEELRYRVTGRGASRLHWHQPGLETSVETARRKLSASGWPLQADHVRITDADWHRWIKGRFVVRDRRWVDGFLTFDLERPA
ncbi:class I SAM-dependent methyltransferase [Prosthecomicrobium sp. N25]|uniref:class I SAM-dependent methyltransferase n=1 Tax=Prosthecomicrobium sp. N25 TaxID=3129254 RepID=UPI003076FC2E